jgi:DNA mismatch repair ATPase MutL
LRFSSNNKELLMVSHRLSTRERLATLWKIPTQAFVAFSHEVNGIQAEGYVALPHYAKSNRSYQLFSLNGRLIKSQALSQAVLEGFGPMMTRGKYPVAFVQLTLDPAQVDVNVHPSKAEVRFADNKSPFRAIYRGIAHALETEQADTVDPDDWAKAVREPSTLASLDEMVQENPPSREEPKRYEAPRPNFSWSGTMAQQRGSQELGFRPPSISTDKWMLFANFPKAKRRPSCPSQLQPALRQPLRRAP